MKGKAIMRGIYLAGILLGGAVGLSGAAHAASLTLNGPCDIKSKVPVSLLGFDGSDVTAIIKGYDKLKPKDEYETTASFKARHSKDVVSLASPLQCIAVQPESVSSKYDADHKRLTVDINSWPTGYGDTEGVRFVTDRKVISSSDYVGSNAFGVTKSVTKTESVEYGVSFDKRAYLAGLRKIGALKDPEIGISHIISMPATPEKAKAIGKYNLRILLVYKWVPPYILTDSDYHEATITEPHEDHTSSELLRAHLMKVIVFDITSGEILFDRKV